MANVAVIVSVDWEGRDLVPDSIDAMEAFRKRYPFIPMQQFLNAAYYTKPSANPEQLTIDTRRTLLEDDILGLHIHAWRSLFEAAGVEPKREPNFREYGGPMRVVDGDWGHEIAIDAFTRDELSRVIQTSIKILDEQGFGQPTEFRSGAWLSGPSVIEALIDNGFRLDASAVNRRFIKRRWGTSPLYKRLSELWDDISDTSQPYYQQSEEGRILQVPNNGCLADYTSPKDILKVFEANLQEAKKNPAQTKYVSIGFHQETANKFLPNIEKGIRLIMEKADKTGAKLSFVASPFH
ncbi:hypothetical protein [Pseudobacteriovorax antillogorgiicola]|uniref:YdjC-like protein n=1 Tax=Pseudobacteriovorax antillogorgiicola TaxID=1513793 RepID=A0A1Y6CNC8_9BACT|nr:hypothetical protein [Pseudobacteriovorax antillogorgiicola]TCS43657.1 hypothetical protein EDD56_13550 [Pseudobacteriovorax antillogorgiicola]SMF79653.1 hypothetical protein SAMN06296036_1343 [Pseudobacteriovorax antillogorgiicola]